MANKKFNAEHKQVPVNIFVDEKVAPLIQYIINNYPSVYPFASCQGPDENGKITGESSADCYISFFVRDMMQFNQLLSNLEIQYAQYQIASNDLGCVPSWRISIEDLDAILEKIEYI